MQLRDGEICDSREQQGAKVSDSTSYDRRAISSDLVTFFSTGVAVTIPEEMTASH